MTQIENFILSEALLEWTVDAQGAASVAVIGLKEVVASLFHTTYTI